MKGNITWISFNSVFLNYVKIYDESARLGYVVDTISESIINTINSLKTINNQVFIDADTFI